MKSIKWFLFISFFTACGQKSSPDSVIPSNIRGTAVHSYLDSVDEMYKEIFLKIEIGGYADAEELIQKNIPLLPRTWYEEKFETK